MNNINEDIAADEDIGAGDIRVKREVVVANGGQDVVDNNHGSDGHLSTVATTSSTSTAELALRSTEDNKIQVFFVETKTFKSSSQSGQTSVVGRQPRDMQMAFTSMKSYKFDTHWIKEEEVVRNGWSDGGLRHRLFIMDSFDGPAFDHLRGLGARIIGPLCVLYCFSADCLNRFKTIPEKTYPLFSQCMRKLFVTISGFDGQRKRELIARIEKMCGNYSKDYTRRVTHLVTDSVRTKKYRVAKQCGSAVVSSHWVDDCWTIYQHEYSCAGDDAIVDKYRLKIFNKLMITVSQVDLAERTAIQKLVEENGGLYSPSLKLNANNCLLLVKEASGDKFKYAHLKGIPCLDVQWLYDSIDKGFTQSEDEYIVGTDSLKAHKMASQVANHKAVTAANTSKQLHKLDSNVLNNNKHNNHTDKDRTSITSVPETDSVCLTPAAKDNPNDDIIKRIDSLINSDTRADEPFLDGCDVYLIGFKRPIYESIKRALNSSGSMVYNEFKDIITHVIIGPDVDISEVFDLCANRSCKIVTIGWLYQCLQHNECSDCSPYEKKRPKNSQKSNGTQPAAKRRKTDHSFEGPLTITSPKSLKTRQLNQYNHMSIGVGLGFNEHFDVQWDDSSQSSQ